MLVMRAVAARSVRFTSLSSKETIRVVKSTEEKARFWFYYAIIRLFLRFWYDFHDLSIDVCRYLGPMYSYIVLLMYHQLRQYGKPLLLFSRLNRHILIGHRLPLGIKWQSEENAKNWLCKELIMSISPFQLHLRHESAAPCFRHTCQLTRLLTGGGSAIQIRPPQDIFWPLQHRILR